MAKGDGCNHLLDAFCGSGLFALSAAAHFQTVHGVELMSIAVQAAIHNAQINNIDNADFTV